MKKARLILSASMLSFAALSAVTFSSCSKDEEECLVGYAGSDCKTEVRQSYFNTYRGNGSDSDGDTYTNWALKFSAQGTDVTKMRMNLLDETDASVLALVVTLQTNTTFSVDSYTTSDGYTYTGNGSINENTASLTLREATTGSTLTYTFTNMNK
jgi:hypothetical protein